MIRIRPWRIDAIVWTWHRTKRDLIENHITRTDDLLRVNVINDIVVALVVAEQTALLHMGMEFGFPSLFWNQIPALASKSTEVRDIRFVAEESLEGSHIETGMPEAIHRVVDTKKKGAPKIFWKLMLSHNSHKGFDEISIFDLYDAIQLFGVWGSGIPDDALVFAIVGNGDMFRGIIAMNPKNFHAKLSTEILTDFNQFL
jgi:hypothetical protein